MLVRHIMCTELVSLPSDLTVIEALRALKSHRIRRAPILDDAGGLAGFVTERDLLRATPGTVAEISAPSGRAACARTVGEVANTKVIAVHPDDHIEDVARLFLAKKIGGVPVVNDGVVVGLITESDIFRAVLGAAHLSDATRLTVQRSRASDVQPVRSILDSLALEIAGLTEYPGPDGREVFVLRVRGERVSELSGELSQAGWVVLDRRAAG